MIICPDLEDFQGLAALEDFQGLPGKFSLITASLSTDDNVNTFHSSGESSPCEKLLESAN